MMNKSISNQPPFLFSPFAGAACPNEKGAAALSFPNRLFCCKKAGTGGLLGFDCWSLLQPKGTVGFAGGAKGLSSLLGLLPIAAPFREMCPLFGPSVRTLSNKFPHLLVIVLHCMPTTEVFSSF